MIKQALIRLIGTPLLRWLLGAWLLHLSASLALRGSTKLLLLLGLTESVAALLFMVGKTMRAGAVLLLLTFTFAAGFHLRAGERPGLLVVYAVAVIALTGASSQRARAAASKLVPEDRAFLRAFEATQLAPADFHHRDHIRAAWAMLKSYPVGEALGRYSAALRRLAQRAGKPEVYHETITWAYLLLIHERIQRHRRDLPFSEFAEQNPDLLNRNPSLVETYYRPQDLASERARQVFILPGGPAYL